jgi:hypothetical protein
LFHPPDLSIRSKETVGLLNTVFPSKDFKKILLFETSSGVYTLVNVSDRIQFIKSNPKFKNKTFHFAEDIIYKRLEELGYSNRQEFIDKKGTIFGITPFFSQEGLAQIPSEKDLPQVTTKK